LGKEIVKKRGVTDEEGKVNIGDDKRKGELCPLEKRDKGKGGDSMRKKRLQKV